MPKELDIKKLLKDQTEKLTEIFDDRIKSVTEQYNDINDKFSKIDRTLKSHTQQIANILVDVGAIKIKMSDVDYSVKMRLDRKIDKVNFVDLEGRVRKLEKK